MNFEKDRPFFDIRAYHDYISPRLAHELLAQAEPVSVGSDLFSVGSRGGLETTEALKFLVALYEQIRLDLKTVLDQRTLDRKFIDERMRASSELNDQLQIDLLDSNYKTILGLRDAKDRVVFGPLSKKYAKAGGAKVAPIPSFLRGPHVTLFGPPDSAKMAINAMNAYHRKIAGEPSIVAEILKKSKVSPMWGADDEDSKTPLRADLIDAAVNLTGCFEKTLKIDDGVKKYELAEDHLSLPIKRFPGLALPSPFLFYKRNPIPLHLYDFALHIYRNWQNEQSLVFYVPKLENEEEARYIHKMVSTAERLIKAEHPEYVEGSVRLMVVLENPRAILRTHEIMDALYPYFVGASLGWHDYLASTARLFKEDHHYRIPVKADPDIVIKYIKASHLLLADVVGSRGGIKVGGMYGILPLDADLRSPSFQMTLKGFIKDVIIQLKRDLTGFWVAHPDFVRLGLALVEAYKMYQAKKKAPLIELVRSLLDKKYHKEILDYIAAKDIQGLDKDDPNYVRSLIVADIKESDFIANNHPEEIRYNVFQSLQYLTDWLAGNGCVALPAEVNGVAVRVMDDLATAERSRWEVWHELRHQRFAIDDFLRIAHEEMNFIRKDLSNSKKIVQVKWNEKTEKWYPIAMKLMLQLMTDPHPPEFATELLMPFTIEKIREAQDPWAAIRSIDADRYQLSEYIERFNRYFEACGCQRFAAQMAAQPIGDLEMAGDLIRQFKLSEVNEAAAFHGNIGEGRRTLDKNAQGEQSAVLAEADSIRQELLDLGAKYRKKFGFKFLISAQGKSSAELLGALNSRMKNQRSRELRAAADALSEIAIKRLRKVETSSPNVFSREKVDALREQYKINAVSIAVNQGLSPQNLVSGAATPNTFFQLASLSKTLATAFALDYFAKNKIPLEMKVNELLKKNGSSYRLPCDDHSEWADQVEIQHLLNHTALNKHYIAGTPLNVAPPSSREALADVKVIHHPGEIFKYSGGGFLVLEHLIETLEGRSSKKRTSIHQLTQKYLANLGLKNTTFWPQLPKKAEWARGHFDSGLEVEGGRYNFAPFAAGAMGTAHDMALFLKALTTAYNLPAGARGLTHDIAIEMLRGVDRGSYEFMGAAMGLGVFVAEAGENRIAIHQGANEGYRALFVQVFSGPDVGKGFVILCNGDNQAVLFIASLAQELLRALNVRGVRCDQFVKDFQFKSIEQEQIVNLGYKKLIFDAFDRTLPEAIENVGPLDPLAEYNLATSATLVSVSNQRFARAKNLLSPHLPSFDPELFGRQGKIMDSWESARHNEKPFDHVVINLKKPSTIRFVSLSTQFHDGNHPATVRITVRHAQTNEWSEIVPTTPLQGHSLLKLKLSTGFQNITQVRVEMAPDGGLSRLGLYDSLPESTRAEFRPLSEARSRRFEAPIPKTLKPMVIPYEPTKKKILRNLKVKKKNKKTPIDYASSAFGGKLIHATNEHYGPAIQVISPYPPINMFDGLESARSRKIGHFEEVILQLGKKIAIRRIVFDFRFFVNNNPKFVSVEGQIGKKWVELVPKTNVKAFAGQQKEFRLQNKKAFQVLRVRTFPDGGVNRIHVFTV